MLLREGGKKRPEVRTMVVYSPTIQISGEAGSSLISQTGPEQLTRESQPSPLLRADDPFMPEEAGSHTQRSIHTQRKSCSKKGDTFEDSQPKNKQIIDQPNEDFQPQYSTRAYSRSKKQMNFFGSPV